MKRPDFIWADTLTADRPKVFCNVEGRNIVGMKSNFRTINNAARSSGNSTNLSNLERKFGVLDA